MNTSLKKIVVLLAFIGLVVPVLSAQTSREMVELDPAVQGVWYVYATSYDKGVTMEYMNGEALCRVTGSYVVMANGKRTDFVSIRYYQDEDGVIYNIIDLGAGNPNWVVSKNSPPWILVQVFDTTTGTETLRIMVRQSR